MARLIYKFSLKAARDITETPVQKKKKVKWFFFFFNWEQGMVVCICDPSIWKAVLVGSGCLSYIYIACNINLFCKQYKCKATQRRKDFFWDYSSRGLRLIIAGTIGGRQDSCNSWEWVFWDSKACPQWHTSSSKVPLLRPSPNSHQLGTKYSNSWAYEGHLVQTTTEVILNYMELEASCSSTTPKARSLTVSCV